MNHPIQPPPIVANQPPKASSRPTRREPHQRKSHNWLLPAIFAFLAVAAVALTAVAILAVNQGAIPAPGFSLAGAAGDPLAEFASESPDHAAMAEWFRENLDEPDSFELIEVEGPKSFRGRLTYYVKYRANWFGHPNVTSNFWYVEDGEAWRMNWREADQLKYFWAKKEIVE